MRENVKYFLYCKNDKFALVKEYLLLLNCSYPKEHNAVSSGIKPIPFVGLLFLLLQSPAAVERQLVICALKSLRLLKRNCREDA